MVLEVTRRMLRAMIDFNVQTISQSLGGFVVAVEADHQLAAPAPAQAAGP